MGQEGARRWLRARGRLKELVQYEKELRVEREFVTLALQTRDELKQIYSAIYRSRETDLRRKEAAFARFKRDALRLDRRYGGSLKIERWFKKPVNNARLVTLSTYYDLLPGFEALLKRQGGDLEKFFTEVESMRRLRHDARQQKIKSLVTR